jgi:hypothetical protein
MLPKIGMPRRRGKYYIKLVIDGDVKQITVAQKGEAVSWPENVYL